MTGSALFDFIIAIISLIGAGVLVFLGIDFIAPDERFKRIAKVAVGIAFLILFLFAIKAVLFGGGGAGSVTPAGIIEFAISLIVLLVVVYLLNMALEYFAGALGEPIILSIRYVIGALALIVILVAAERVILGGGLGFIKFGAGTDGRPLIEQQHGR